MDPLAGLLDGARAHGAFLVRACFDPPWSVRVEDGAPLTVMLPVRGDAWLIPESGAPLRMHPGDMGIARGPDAYTVADTPDGPPRAVIHPGGHCSTPDGRSLVNSGDLGLRTWGDRLDGEAVLLIGTYTERREINRRLLDALPPLLVAPAADSPLTALFGQEISRSDPGQEVVLDRLLDLLVIAGLRAWFARPDAEPPGWYAALGDPVVGPALRLLRDAPARPWTVAHLATEVGVSRAALARRFTDLVGEPPMAYLTGWRLALAADLLAEPDATVAAVARQVGYSTPFALSTAFKRAYGVSPRDYRATAPQA